MAVPLLYRTYPDQVRIETEVNLTFFDGPDAFQQHMRDLVFGANVVQPVDFRAIVGPNLNFPDANGNIVDAHAPMQIVSGQILGRNVRGRIIGQIVLSAQRQLVLLVIESLGVDGTLDCYIPAVHEWQTFQRDAHEITARGVLLVQLNNQQAMNHI